MGDCDSETQQQQQKTLHSHYLNCETFYCREKSTTFFCMGKGGSKPKYPEKKVKELN
jgi:hypothetical protein